MKIKKELAFKIVKELYDLKKAEEAKQSFENTVQKDELPNEIPTISVNEAFAQGRYAIDILLATKLAESRSDAKRLIEQGGVEINNKKITHPKELINYQEEMLIKIGKRKFLKIKIQ